LYHGAKQIQGFSLKQGDFMRKLSWVADHPHEADTNQADANVLHQFFLAKCFEFSITSTNFDG
jgi:hypothetical protein